MIMSVVNVFLAAGSVLGAGLAVQPLANGDFLEPSVQNEVDHALALAERRVASASVGRAAMPAAWTNGLNGTDAAIRLVSLQKPDGSWRNGTNEVTRATISALRWIAGIPDLPPPGEPHGPSEGVSRESRNRAAPIPLTGGPGDGG